MTNKWQWCNYLLIAHFVGSALRTDLNGLWRFSSQPTFTFTLMSLLCLKSHEYRQLYCDNIDLHACSWSMQFKYKRDAFRPWLHPSLIGTQLQFEPLQFSQRMVNSWWNEKGGLVWSCPIVPIFIDITLTSTVQSQTFAFSVVCNIWRLPVRQIIWKLLFD